MIVGSYSRSYLHRNKKGDSKKQKKNGRDKMNDCFAFL
jgi:hypothetical protein